MPLKIINNKKFRKLPKAIIFDTDNTLYSYAPANQLALKSVFTKAETLLDINRITGELQVQHWYWAQPSGIFLDTEISKDTYIWYQLLKTDATVVECRKPAVLV